MMQYAVVFEVTPTGWSAGLGVAAPSIEEAERLIREGIEFHTKAFAKMGYQFLPLLHG